MSACDCHNQEPRSRAERRVLGIALALNVSMFFVEAIAGWIAGSSALLADALDMLADALGYGIALWAIGNSGRAKARSALASSAILSALAVGVIVETLRRVWTGSAPEGAVMFAVAVLALIVNSIVLWMLSRYRAGEVHLRAAWIFTRADVVANVGVIIAAVLVRVTHSRIPDLIAGLAIGVYVVKEAFEIRAIARETPQERQAEGKSL